MTNTNNMDKDKEKEKEKDKKSRYKFQTEIQQMMFVFGEIADPLPETTMLVEDIVRSQVIEIIIQAAAMATKRNSRSMNAEDLIFLMRHDRAKVNRLRSFLSWKDVRKNAKETGGDQVEDMMEDSATAEKPGKMHRSIIKLSWELVNQFSDVFMKSSKDDDSEDEDEIEAYNDSIQRLKDADEVTRAMTREEYVHYSECRQASFTYRKSKRFRDWAYMSSFIDVKPNDDIIDSLGFLTFEMVSSLTEGALQIKTDLTALHKDESAAAGKKRKRESGDEDGDESTMGLFSLSQNDETPLEPLHIQEAFRRLQLVPQPLKTFRRGLVRTKISLI